MSYEAFDHIEVRCPQLGHQINFGYCRQRTEGLPCTRAIDCFYLKFPVQKYFRLVLKKETFRRLFIDSQTPRLDKLFQTVDTARKTAGE